MECMRCKQEMISAKLCGDIELNADNAKQLALD